MSNIRKLERPRNEGVIMYLEAALERAKTGETTGVVLVEQGPTGGYQWSTAGVEDGVRAAGMLALAQNRVLDRDDG